MNYPQIAYKQKFYFNCGRRYAKILDSLLPHIYFINDSYYFNIIQILFYDVQ